ncbi:hypothetical protein N431DRAFT_426586 [Stipitochalara longipes BDJ]|nr:hypothetical protein N431DRAFT_426586 [Stipitochalara longipes BDJ]
MSTDHRAFSSLPYDSYAFILMFASSDVSMLSRLNKNPGQGKRGVGFERDTVFGSRLEVQEQMKSSAYVKG